MDGEPKKENLTLELLNQEINALKEEMKVVWGSVTTLGDAIQEIEEKFEAMKNIFRE